MLTEQTKKDIKTHILHYLAEQDISERELAKLSGINSSYLNAITKGEWTGYKMGTRTINIADKYFEKVSHTIGFQYEKSYWKHFDTVNFKTVKKACNKAKRTRARVGIDGFTGSGKTHALELFKRENVNETFLVKCSGDMNPKDFVLEIARAIGVDTQGSRYALRKSISSKLKSMRRPLLIIDEAENIKKEAVLDAIKGMCDELENRCGIVLAGMGIQDKWAKLSEKKRYCYPQINRRFKGAWFTMFHLSEADIRQVCDGVGIKSNGAVKFLMRNVHDYGHLSHLLAEALREADERNLSITGELLQRLTA